MFKAQISVKVWTIGAITGLLLAGCGASPDHTTDTSSPSQTPSDTPAESPSPSTSATPSAEPGSGLSVQTSVATYQAQGNMWPTAALEGSLIVLDSGCLVVREQQGENAFIPVFPLSHETVAFDGQTLHLGTTTVKVGESITLGGSALEWSDSYPELNYTMPTACHDLDTWWASPSGM